MNNTGQWYMYCTYSIMVFCTVLHALLVVALCERMCMRVIVYTHSLIFQ